MCEIKDLYKFFLDNKDSFIQKYTGQFLVISASHDVSAFPSRQEAYTFGTKTYGLGNMMIQECSLGALNKVRKFHNGNNETIVAFRSPSGEPIKF